MELVTYIPSECTNGAMNGCELLITYSRFDIPLEKKNEAQLQFWTTIFTCGVLVLASLVFSNDTTKIVINPIKKIVEII